MTLFARRDAVILGTDRLEILRAVANLRELAGETYFYCGPAIRRSLEVDRTLLPHLEDTEVTRLAHAITDPLVPPLEVLDKVVRALSDMWILTRSRSINDDEADPRHERMRELLIDPDVKAWLSQTLSAFERFGICPAEQRERVLHYARQFYAGQAPRI